MQNNVKNSPNLLYNGNAFILYLSLILLISPIMPLLADTAHAATPSNLSALPHHPNPTDALKPFSLTYSARYDGLPFGGKAVRTLTYDHNSGLFSLVTKANSFLMKLREQSEFHWNAADCQATPNHYTYKRTGLGKNKRHEIHFDYTQTQEQKDARSNLNMGGKATYTTKNKTSLYDTPFGSTDRLTEQLVVRCLVQQGVKEMTIHVARKSKMVTHAFKVVGEEEVKTPLGILNTTKVARIHDDAERKTLLWFAKAHDYALVKLEQIDEGKRYSIELDAIENH